MNITLIRHPRTTANARHIIYGKMDYPYADKGELQYKWVIDYMTTHYGNKYNEGQLKIITSPRGRAQKLAEGIGESIKIPVVVDERMAEMDFGIFEGHTMEEVEKLYPKDYDNFVNNFEETTPPEGESYDDFSDRIDDLLMEIEEHILMMKSGKMNPSLDATNVYDISNLPSEELIIVSHGGVIRELTERILELEPAGSWKYIIGNGCIIQFDLSQDGYKLKQLIANGI